MRLMIFAVLAFVVVGMAQLVQSLPGGERGLLLFEKACPIHSSPSGAPARM
jgi:hypothetical protein